MVLGGRVDDGVSTAAVFAMTVNADGICGEWTCLPPMPVSRQGGVAVALVPDLEKIVAEMRTVTSLTDFPPGLLPLMASYLGAERVFIAGGAYGDNLEDTIQRYSLDSGRWETKMAGLPAMDTLFHGSLRGQAIGNRRLLIFGNGTSRPRFEGELIRFRVTSFDAHKERWAALPSMIYARPGCCSAEWEGRVFVFGGFYDVPLFSCECYDTVTDRWSFIASMKTPRYDAVAVSVPGLGILVMGGSFASHTSHVWPTWRTVDLYNPNTNCWTTMPWNLPTPLHNFVAHCIAGRIYLIGGVSDHICAECWSMDLTVDSPSWIPLPSLPIPTYQMASVLLQP